MILCIGKKAANADRNRNDKAKSQKKQNHFPAKFQFSSNHLISDSLFSCCYAAMTDIVMVHAHSSFSIWFLYIVSNKCCERMSQTFVHLFCFDYIEHTFLCQSFLEKFSNKYSEYMFAFLIVI